MKTEQISEHFNQIAQQYDEQRKLFIPCFDDYYGLGVSFLKSIKNNAGNILDLGAGTGLLTKFLYEKYPNADYTLVDISDKMLEVAKIRFEGLHNFKFLVSDYSKELPNEKFDLISSALSIHHLENNNKLSLYSNIYDKLSIGGCFLNLDQFNASSNEMNEKYNEYWYEHIKAKGIISEDMLKRRELDRENTIDETKEMLVEVGFKNVECIYSYMKFGVVLAWK